MRKIINASHCLIIVRSTSFYYFMKCCTCPYVERKYCVKRKYLHNKDESPVHSDGIPPSVRQIEPLLYSMPKSGSDFTESMSKERESLDK